MQIDTEIMNTHITHSGISCFSKTFIYKHGAHNLILFQLSGTECCQLKSWLTEELWLVLLQLVPVSVMNMSGGFKLS